ncbi:MAG: response regulator [Sarcina sp.]|nr:response regulator [Sarcina sp.]
MRKSSANGKFYAIGVFLVVLILFVGTIWTGQSAGRATEEAVHSVSMFYLEELAGRREEVVAKALSGNVSNIYTAIGLLEEEYPRTAGDLQVFQGRIKRLYNLDKFALVDEDGLIYTSSGRQTNIAEYPFDYKGLTAPGIYIKDLQSKEKKVIIAVPLEGFSFEGKRMQVCFMEIDMKQLLEGISLRSADNGSTFCNIYTRDGVALTDMVLGGLASEDNLLSAMEIATYEKGFSLETLKEDFNSGHRGVITFTYNGIKENLYYVPIEGTDWLLTYLIRESVIQDHISTIFRGIVVRSLLQSILTASVMLAMFAMVIVQNRRSAKLRLEKETSEAESRVKQEALEQRIALQEELLEKEKLRVQQDNMITAMASDYRSVYYVDLDKDEGICYRADQRNADTLKEGEQFCFSEAFRSYAEKYVAESWREDFLAFIDPDNIRRRLAEEVLLVHRYLTVRDGREIYEMLRMASVQHAEDRAGSQVHAIGVGFTDIDQEMRDSMAKNQALSDALAAAEEANRAKSAFLSNMSHEIRTPMNAIIGLDNIALNEPGLSARTREYLEKISGSARHLLNIINDILDMSRIESGRMAIRNEEFSFSRLLENVNTMVSGQCHDKGLDYQCRIVGHVDDQYIGDDMKLRQVLINILSNAVKFTEPGGHVDLIVERTARFDGKSTLCFKIKDTGIGMDKDFLPRIFDAFSQEDSSSTNKYGSTGLGMAITKNIVELMNGRIEVESEKGVGTTFTVTVTLMDVESPFSEEYEELKPHELSVLIIDDDPVACEHARLVLEKVGIASETASSGKEAVEMVRLRHARREPYNLILVDWKMPEMDGIETTRQIRGIAGEESAIIFLTAYRWEDVLEEATEAGVDSFVSKPLFAGAVMEEFKKALRRRNAAIHKEGEKADLDGRRILLAEDVQINAEIIIMLLNTRGVTVDHAENGRAAVDMFTSQPAGTYDAILMDMRMPEMDGLTATGIIRGLKDHEDAAEIPIIALTANAFDEDVQRSLQAGLNAHLSKPVEPDNLYETLESLIGAREAKK